MIERQPRLRIDLVPSTSKASAAAWPPALLHPPRMGQCIVLALLLHILVVVMFGTAPGGGARPGERIWGRLSVSLSNSSKVAEPGGSTLPAPNTLVETDRPSKTDRQPIPTPDLQSTRRALPRPPVPAPEATIEPAPTSIPAPASPVLREMPSTDAAPGILEAPPELKPAPIPLSTFDQIKPLAALATPMSRPAIEPASAPASAPRSAPMPVPIPAPAPAPASAPRADPVAALAPPSELEPMPAPVQAPSQTPAPAPAPTKAPAAAPPDAAPPERTPAAPAELKPALAPSLPTLPSLAAPDAGSRPGDQIAPPAAPSSAPRPKLDLSLPRGSALPGQGSRGLLQLLPPPPERKSKLSEGIEKSAREDCRTAYGGAGLLAVIPLVGDAARDKGCRW